MRETNQPPVSRYMPGVWRYSGRVNLRQLHHHNPQRYPFLLETTAQAIVDEQSHSQTANYDILFAFPGQRIELRKDNLLYHDDRLVSGESDFFQYLDTQWHKHAEQYFTDSSLPFCGGWFLYLSYELAGQVEHRLHLPMPDDDAVIASATRIPAAIIYDHAKDETIIVIEAEQLLIYQDIEEDIAAITNTLDMLPADFPSLDIVEDEPQRYLDNVERVRQYIIDGDVFQVNLSRRWTAKRPGALSAYDVYQKLVKTNPAPFSGLMLFNFGSIISSSPERLVRVKNGIVDTRPIAGTRPRGQQGNDDRANRDELIGHPKERAEHIMLIDLERNDLGRVCKPGTVSVDELMTLESYAHVHHIVSNVKGELRDDITPGDVIRAVFPGGTITGCPKERCMAIIAELEQEARGAYTGSVGYLNHNGDMDLNILIRTITMNDNTITLRAGAGLVFDSVAENELQETRYKAKGMLLALGMHYDG